VERRASTRNAAIVHLFVYAGLRIGELSALELDDVADFGPEGHIDHTFRQGRRLPGSAAQCRCSHGRVGLVGERRLFPARRRQCS
jgi:integrase